jgi:hypothetical protein
MAYSRAMLSEEEARSMVDENKKRTDTFALTEYAAIREEAKWIIEQVDRLENTALIFSGAIWAWVGTQAWKLIYIPVVWLPLVLSILFFIKRESLRRSLGEVAEYMMTIENHFIPQGGGWEHYLKSKKARHFRLWKRIFWTSLILFNLTAALLMILLNRPAC